MDQRIDAGCVERVPAHQQRLEAEDPPKLFVLDVLAGQAPNAAVGAQSDHVGGSADHAADRAEGLVAKLCEADVEYAFGVIEEPQVPVAIARLKLADLLEHLLDRSAIVE